MTVRGTNHAARKVRLIVAFAVAHADARRARQVGDTQTAEVLRARIRRLRLAWQRLDDHLYPKAGAR